MPATFAHDFVRGLRNPGAASRARAVAARWADLPEEARSVPHQWLGRVTAGCTATWGLHERCDFSCTACYLGRDANQTPPLPMAEVRRQLEAIAAWVGPGGPVQLTAGEVTLLPATTLIRIVRMARSLGLDPMVMTHGQTFERDPSYLRRLVVEGGLAKVAIHVDSTQRGRDGVRRPVGERMLDPVRDRFAALIRRTRRETGRPLLAALTATVTDDTADDVEGTVRWAMRNADAFRMLSLQPVAPVGRTRASVPSTGLRPRVWEAARRGTGRPRLNPHTFQIGHPDCNDLSLFWVVRFGDELRVVEARREGAAVDDGFFRGLPAQGLGTLVPDAAPPGELLGRLVGLLARSPSAAARWPTYAVRRLADELPDWGPRFLTAVVRGAPWFIRPFALVAHHFMSPADLATPTGRARLAACNFRVPVDGRMVPMCEMNAGGVRDRVSARARSAGRRLPVVGGGRAA